MPKERYLYYKYSYALKSPKKVFVAGIIQITLLLQKHRYHIIYKYVSLPFARDIIYAPIYVFIRLISSRASLLILKIYII